jgi:hypothetical protein
MIPMTIVLAACVAPATTSMRGGDRTVRHSSGAALVLREIPAGNGAMAALIVFDVSRQRFWWAPLRPDERAEEVAQRLFLAGDAIADFILVSPPPTLVGRLVSMPASSLDEAERLVREQREAGAYRIIDLRPHLDRSFYENPATARNPLVLLQDVARENGHWAVTLGNDAGAPAVHVTITDAFELTRVRRSE